MNENAVYLEEERLHGLERSDDFPSFHERHRVFPAIFEDRQHKRIIDTSAGVGYAAQHIEGGDALGAADTVDSKA